jgi:diacylglycerol kinase family enzyme
VLLNTDAQIASAEDLAGEILRHFSNHRIRAKVTTLKEGSQVDIAARLALTRKPDVMVAGGGDGTLSTVAGVVAGTEIPLGVLPLGTLNHFAKDLGIPLDLAGAIETIARGRVIQVDAGRINGRIFLNNSSLGLYPLIVQRRDELRQKSEQGKWLSVLWALLFVLRRFPFLDARINLDGEVLSRHTPLLFVGNNSYELNALNFGARKRLDAGHLSVHIINRTDRWGLVALFLRTLVGRLEESRDFETLYATHIEVNTARGRVNVAMDGEVKRLATPLVYEIEPHALSVIVPEEQSEQEI